MPQMFPALPFLMPEREEDRYLPEGPRFMRYAGAPTLVWVNIQDKIDATTGSVCFSRFDTGGQRLDPIVGRPGFALPVADAELIIGIGKQICRFETEKGNLTILASIPDSNPRTIINDAESSPDGRFIVFGTKDLKFAEPIACLYAFDRRTNSIRVLLDGQTCSNGKVFEERDGGLYLLDIDTPTRKVMRYRVDPNTMQILESSVALDVSDQIGFPDGMVAGDEDHVIIAFYNPAPVEFGRAVEFDLRTGAETRAWLTPKAPRVTCPLLIEREGRKELYLTTCTEGMSAEDFQKCPNSGTIFRAVVEER